MLHGTLGRSPAGAEQGSGTVAEPRCGSVLCYLEHGSFLCMFVCVNSSLFSLFQLTGRLWACLFEPLQEGGSAL